MKSIFSIFIFLFCSSLQAKIHWVQYRNLKVSFEAPKTWESYIDNWGIPISLVSPRKNISRVIVGVSPAQNSENIHFTAKKLEDSESAYQAEKRQWLTKKKAKLVKFLPYYKENWKNVKDVHVAGMKYESDGIIYTENTYFLNCKGLVYHLRSLYRDKDFSREEKKINNIVKSFNCQKPIVKK